MPNPPQPPNFTGTWRADLAKSILLRPAPRQIVQRIEHREPRIQQEALVTHTSGDQERVVFVYDTTGAETTNTLGAKTVRARAHWHGAELVIESWVEISGRDLHFKDYWSLSNDGQTLTMQHRDDDLAGQTVVHEKLP